MSNLSKRAQISLILLCHSKVKSMKSTNVEKEWPESSSQWIGTSAIEQMLNDVELMS